jgi:hypothetical protein
MAKYCCDLMKLWSRPHDGEPIVIHQSKVGLNVGIRINAGGNAFVAIRHCPWCGTALQIADELVGKRMVEG